MVACAVRFCSNRSTRKEEHEKKNRISFHRFPQDPKIYTAWVNALRVRREHWTPKKSSVVCSDHFTYDCFDSSDFQRRLVRHAIPTIFPDIDPSLEIKKPTPQRRIPNLLPTEQPRLTNLQFGSFVIIDASKIVYNGEGEATSSKEMIVQEKNSDTQLISRATSVSPSPKKESLNISKCKESNYLKKIRQLQIQSRKNVKRIEALKTILNNLRKKDKRKKQLPQDHVVLGSANYL